MSRIRIFKRCPLCRAKPEEGSGGWAVDYQCGTRRGNMSGSVIWQGFPCIVRYYKQLLKRIKRNVYVER